jgi:hypothetical protein
MDSTSHRSEKLKHFRRNETPKKSGTQYLAQAKKQNSLEEAKPLKPGALNTSQGRKITRMQ